MFLLSTACPLINYSKLGLVRISVIAHAPHPIGFREIESLQSIDYWTYWTRCSWPSQTLYLTYAIPHNSLAEFARLLQEARSSAALDGLEVLMTGDSKPVDSSLKVSFNAAFRDPGSYECLADEFDMRILEQLEENPWRSSGEISGATGIPVQSVREHFDRCIEPRGLMTMRHPYDSLQRAGEMETWILHASFHDKEEMRGFMQHLRGNRFAGTAVKVRRKDSLIIHFYASKLEGQRLQRRVENELREVAVRHGWLRADISRYGETYAAWTIRPQLFNEGAWAKLGVNNSVLVDIAVP